MAWHLVQRFGLAPFVIDQVITVEFRRLPARMRAALRELTSALLVLGGSGGYLAEEAPEPWCREGVDAVVLSLDNKLE
jgi:phage FluMu gp28-like protein